MKILVTGAAGFIGFHLVQKLCEMEYSVIGIDNINDYYDVNLKYARLSESGINKENIEYGCITASSKYQNYIFIKLDITDKENIFSLFKKENFDIVCNLAAQAGVRYSLENPNAYIDSNITGFLNILEACKTYPVKHLVFASSSSVYGINQKIPFSVNDNVDKPVSLYAATKRSNELIAHTYSHLFNIPMTGLRFFTVYGPWGRPDMAYFKFAKKIYENQPIDVYNNGDMLRDFTYIDDIIKGIMASIEHIPLGSPPLSIYNLGNNHPVNLNDFIKLLENALGKKAEKIYKEMQPGDVPVTFADIDKTKLDLNWQPQITIDEGLIKFSKWFKEYNVI